MILPALTIARATLVEGLRQPIFFVVLFGSAVAQILNTANAAYTFGYRSSAAGEVTGDDKMLLDVGLATVFVGGILLAAFIATSAVSREIENKTVLTIVSKPVSRPAVVIGKFLGVAAAMLLGSIVMICHFLFGLEHGVMSTAADNFHGPVITFGAGGLALCVLFAGFANFWYGWSFNQTFALLMLPVSVLGYLAAAPFEANWGLKPLHEVLEFQVYLACTGVLIALLVMSSLAVAVSTRFGQVMTLMICGGVFLLGLLSNYYVGRYAFQNDPIGSIAEAAPVDLDDAPFTASGQSYVVTLEKPSDRSIRVGDPAYLGPAPNGLAVRPSAFEAPEDIDLTRERFPEGTPDGMVVAGVNDLEVTLKLIGDGDVRTYGPPQPGDWLFTTPTRVNWGALTAWAIIPNMHNFWLTDAVTQASPIPFLHIALVAFYGLFEIGACLSIAVILFQGRDVG